MSGNGVYESNETISYDNIGNPTSYLGASLTWFGRQLKSYTINSQTVNYTYDADGLRSSKSALGVNCTYQYVGGQLRYETRGNQRFYYYYDANGNLSAIRYYDANGTASIYFVLTNAQGDVKNIYSKAGALVASYEYDAFGNCTLTTHVSGETIGELNPIRYRGYYYDSETGFYYLQSRYYNPKVGRFLNADGYVSTGQGVTSYNMFAYCGNNPVMFSDKSGHFGVLAFLGILYVGALTTSVFVGVAMANDVVNTSNEHKINKEIQPKYDTPEEGCEAINKIISIYSTDDAQVIARPITGENMGIHIENSYLVDSRYDRQKVSKIIENIGLSPNRDYDSFSAEWNLHNFVYSILPNGLSWSIKAKHVDLDYNGDPRWYVALPSGFYEIMGWD